MEEYLGRELELNEDVHHIDGNPSNNKIENLEIRQHSEHQKEHSTKYNDKIATCETCGREFLWTAKQQSNYWRDIKRGKRRGINCSKRCSYMFSNK